ncbi:hypothetical protein D3C72_2071490 [compost metagenome]
MVTTKSLPLARASSTITTEVRGTIPSACACIRGRVQMRIAGSRLPAKDLHAIVMVVRFLCGAERRSPRVASGKLEAGECAGRGVGPGRENPCSRPLE